MDKELLADRLKELRALENKIMAFPEEGWIRERARVAELKALVAHEERRATA
jgi:hypothetical protein